MLNKLSGWDDTIVALATASGIGAIGVIRLSGSASIDIINSLFLSKDLSKQRSHTLHVGLITHDEKHIDEVVVSLFKAPKSYTGENVVEISCHGSPYVQQQVIKACIEKGARSAKPGEFTQRAFLNGKLDLTQAEAVADLIASDTAASQRTALHNIRGGFSQVLGELREDLIQFSALIELELDFATEDVEFADRKKLYDLIDTASKRTTRLLHSFQLGNVIKNGVTVAIIGRPNAGKSTLLNTLLNEDRAIVSEIAGTTRDTIEEIININGILFRLIDTAGIREASNDVIETIGIAKSVEKMKSADIVLYIFDAGTTNNEELLTSLQDLTSQRSKYLLLANKTDILPQTKNKFTNEDILYISAKNNIGIGELKEKLFASTVNTEEGTEDTVITNTRHYAALQEVKRSLDTIRAGLGSNIPSDLLALDIRHCLQYISEITGDVSNENILDHIFSKFCIGK